MVGVDFGHKTAITLVVPPKRFVPTQVFPEPCIHCEDTDLWPEGELPEVAGGLHPWKHYCLRQFVYDRNKSTGALSNKRVYTITSGPIYGDDPVYTVTTSWYDFDAGFITDSLIALDRPPPGPCDSTAGLMAVHLAVQFYRERTFNPTPPPGDIVVGDETHSFVQVGQLCYSYGMNINELYGIS